MSDQIMSATIAILLGFGVGVVLFIPFVAISYRRRGRLSIPRFLLWAAALVYFWAIWTYTLLPLPDPDALVCVGAITDPFEIVREVQKGLSHGGNPLSDPAIQQIVLNVLLFLPLGFFLRVLGGRGILVATLGGLGVSLFIETTQLTGVWGIYPCAYRFFDVGDLMTNTAGALIGSVLALLIPRRMRGLDVAPDADLPRPVTKGRRALGMLCDGLGAMLVSLTAGIVVQLGAEFITGKASADANLTLLITTLAVSGLWLVIVLATGRTIGDLAVQLRYAGGPLPVVLARVLRWLGGYAGLLAFGLVPWFGWISVPLMFLSVILLVTTRRGRGLPGLISGQELVDAREPRS